MGRQRRRWTEEEDRLLRNAVESAIQQSRPLLWRELAKSVPGRTNKDCRKRWCNILSGGMNKGAWTESEDERLHDAVQQYGSKWTQVAAAVRTRNSDQCSSHWSQTLNPEIDYSDWTKQEDEILTSAVRKHGTNWTNIMAKHLPNRTTLALKNRYSALQTKMSKGDSSSTRKQNPSLRSRGSTTDSRSSRSTSSGAQFSLAQSDFEGGRFFHEDEEDEEEEEEDEEEDEDDDEDSEISCKDEMMCDGSFATNNWAAPPSSMSLPQSIPQQPSAFMHPHHDRHDSLNSSMGGMDPWDSVHGGPLHSNTVPLGMGHDTSTTDMMSLANGTATGTDFGAMPQMFNYGFDSDASRTISSSSMTPDFGTDFLECGHDSPTMQIDRSKGSSVDLYNNLFDVAGNNQSSNQVTFDPDDPTPSLTHSENAGSTVSSGTSLHSLADLKADGSLQHISIEALCTNDQLSVIMHSVVSNSKKVNVKVNP